MPSRPGRHRNTSVTVAYVHPSMVSARFCENLSAMVLFDAAHQNYLASPGGLISMLSSPRIAEARSQVVDTFLTEEGVDAEWLLWLDADASFHPTLLAELMDVADAAHPVVGALAFGGSGPENMFPTIYGLTPTEGGGWDMDKVLDYPRDALVKVGATGCHTVLIHRGVFLAMAKAYAFRDGKPNPYPWYMEGGVTSKGAPIGEDTSFCINAQALGIPIHVHTGIRVGHVKEVVLDEALWDQQPRAQEARELRLA